MKANEAPDKIYLFENPISGTPNDRWLSKRSDENDIEYIHKDAFIEKACDAYCAICDTKECDGCAECTWVIKFRRQLLKY
jgi:hypothetical protein